MKSQIKKVSVKLLGIVTLVILSSFIGNDSKDENIWTAPPEANDVTNPMNGNTAATLEGKKTFNQICFVCHGDKGKGEGIAGASLTPRPANFTDERICGETDGSLFWKMTSGRAPMASYKAILTDEKRWQLVNYIRQLQENAKPKIK
jgi:mono/diheme cytochrome c family protein